MAVYIMIRPCPDKLLATSAGLPCYCILAVLRSEWLDHLMMGSNDPTPKNYYY